MTEHLTIAAYRCKTGGTQITLAQLDENGRGIGYRIAGPKHHNMGTTTLIEYDLDERDAKEIRAKLDAVFPSPEAAEIERLRAELEQARAAIAKALRTIDDGPQMVNDHVQEHWSVVAVRAERILRNVAPDADEACGENSCHCYCTGAQHHACGCDCPRDNDGQLIRD